MNPSTPDELAKDREVIAGATEGPWTGDMVFCRRARTRYPALVDEVERLRAIVAKLPHSKDGVPIPPDTTIYYIHPNPNAKKRICEVNSNEAPWTNYYGSREWETVRMTIADAYSTYEAALAASQTEKTK